MAWGDYSNSSKKPQWVKDFVPYKKKKRSQTSTTPEERLFNLFNQQNQERVAPQNNQNHNTTTGSSTAPSGVSDSFVNRLFEVIDGLRQDASNFRQQIIEQISEQITEINSFIRITGQNMLSVGTALGELVGKVDENTTVTNTTNAKIKKIDERINHIQNNINDINNNIVKILDGRLTKQDFEDLEELWKQSITLVEEKNTQIEREYHVLISENTTQIQEFYEKQKEIQAGYEVIGTNLEEGLDKIDKKYLKYYSEIWEKYDQLGKNLFEINKTIEGYDKNIVINSDYLIELKREVSGKKGTEGIIGAITSLKKQIKDQETAKNKLFEDLKTKLGDELATEIQKLIQNQESFFKIEIGKIFSVILDQYKAQAIIIEQKFLVIEDFTKSITDSKEHFDKLQQALNITSEESEIGKSIKAIVHSLGTLKNNVEHVSGEKGIQKLERNMEEINQRLFETMIQIAESGSLATGIINQMPKQIEDKLSEININITGSVDLTKLQNEIEKLNNVLTGLSSRVINYSSGKSTIEGTRIDNFFAKYFEINKSEQTEEEWNKKIEENDWLNEFSKGFLEFLQFLQFFIAISNMVSKTLEEEHPRRGSDIIIGIFKTTYSEFLEKFTKEELGSKKLIQIIQTLQEETKRENLRKRYDYYNNIVELMKQLELRNHIEVSSFFRVTYGLKLDFSVYLNTLQKTLGADPFSGNESRLENIFQKFETIIKQQGTVIGQILLGQATQIATLPLPEQRQLKDIEYDPIEYRISVSRGGKTISKEFKPLSKKDEFWKEDFKPNGINIGIARFHVIGKLIRIYNNGQKENEDLLKIIQHLYKLARKYLHDGYYSKNKKSLIARYEAILVGMRLRYAALNEEDIVKFIDENLELIEISDKIVNLNFKITKKKNVKKFTLEQGPFTIEEIGQYLNEVVKVSSVTRLVRAIKEIFEILTFTEKGMEVTKEVLKQTHTDENIFEKKLQEKLQIPFKGCKYVDSIEITTTSGRKKREVVVLDPSLFLGEFRKLSNIFTSLDLVSEVKKVQKKNPFKKKV